MTTALAAQDGKAPPEADTGRDQLLEVTQLAGRLIHELKNHISTIGLNLQLLAEDLAPAESPRERRCLHRVLKLQHECQRLTDLSNDFLRFAQVRELDREPTNLQVVLDDLLDFYGPSARQAHIDMKVFVPGDLPPVLLDQDLFKQAVLNVVLNATQAMPEGGTLTIQGERRGDEVLLSFIDTGVGMSPETVAKMFQPFFTTRANGTGLGLPTLRKIVEAHGGRIQVQSEPGKGTKMTLVLPVATVAGNDTAHENP